MAIYYFCVHAQPTPDHPDAAELQGAFVNCWIKAASAADAERIALAELTSAQWNIESTETAATAEFECTDDNADYLLQAELDGECYVFHTYAADDEEEYH